MAVHERPRTKRRRWRLTFVDGVTRENLHVLTVSKEDPGSIAEAVRLIESHLRKAMLMDGCASVSFGVHVEGSACDHEVGP